MENQSSLAKARSIIAAVFCLLVVLIIVAVVFLLSSRSYPGNQDYSDLIPVPVEVPAESNAFYTLALGSNVLFWPTSQWRQLDNLLSGSAWDEVLATNVLARNQACRNAFEESMQKPYLAVPHPKSSKEDLAYFHGWRIIGSVESIKSDLLLRTHHDSEALSLALKIVSFGQRIENSGGPEVAYLTGASTKMHGFGCIQLMTTNSVLPDEQFLEAIRTLDAFKFNRTGISNYLKTAFQHTSRFIDDVAAGRDPVEEATNSNNADATVSLGSNLAFNVAKTKADTAQTARVLMNSIGKPFSEVPWSEIPVVDTNAPRWLSILKGNVMGIMLFGMMKRDFTDPFNGAYSEDVSCTATQLLLALKIYKSRHGALPDSLSSLVPEFFPAVPTDAFDGKPFRYSPQEQIIYSVGPDLKDSGGAERNQDPKSDDISFKIGF